MEICDKNKKLIFLITQVLPPLLLFYVAFGRSDIGLVFIIIPPLIYSICRVIWLIQKKQYPKLLRPTLTIFLVITNIAMFRYYSAQSILYVRELAKVMQEQCNRDGFCKLPPGNWKGTEGSPTLFHTHTKGPVPILINLSFNESELNSNVDCKNHNSKEIAFFTTFRLNRLIEDNHYIIFGGVGRPLNMPI